MTVNPRPVPDDEGVPSLPDHDIPQPQGPGTGQDPDDVVMTTVEVGQATTSEEAMDALTDEDGFSDESAYTTADEDRAAERSSE